MLCLTGAEEGKFCFTQTSEQLCLAALCFTVVSQGLCAMKTAAGLPQRDCSELQPCCVSAQVGRAGAAADTRCQNCCVSFFQNQGVLNFVHKVFVAGAPLTVELLSFSVYMEAKCRVPEGRTMCIACPCCQPCVVSDSSVPHTFSLERSLRARLVFCRRRAWRSSW